MKRFRVSPQARLDIEDICTYVAADDLDAALRLLSRFESALAKLERHPGLGHTRHDLADRRHRFWSVGSYLVVYLVLADRVEVARVIHAARNIRRVLDEEE